MTFSPFKVLSSLENVEEVSFEVFDLSLKGLDLITHPLPRTLYGLGRVNSATHPLPRT